MNKIKAYGKYEDWKGHINIDNDNNDISCFLEKQGIDTLQNRLIAFEFRKEKKVNFCIFITTELNQKEIEEYFQNKQSIPVTQYIFNIDINEIFNYVKRFNFLVTNNKFINKIDKNVLKTIEK